MIDFKNLQLFAVNATTNNTPGNDLSPEMKTFYDKTLIDLAEPMLVHDQWAQKRPIPQNEGKTIQFRRFSPLSKALTPLTEGVTPSGSALDVSALTATVNQYGDFVSVSDVLDLTAIDPIISETGELIANQAGRTLDTITRNVLVAGTNVSYARKYSGGVYTAVSHRYDLDSTAKLTVHDVKLAVNKLKRQNAPTIDGYYIAIVHPDVAFDLKEDSEWVDASKYGAPEQLFNGEIGRIAGVRFVETTEAKVIKPANLGPTNAYLTVASNVTSSKNIGVTETLTASALVGREVIIGTGHYEITANATNQITIDTAISCSANDKIWPGEGGTQGLPVYQTLIFGKNAYGTTEVTGGGLQMIVKGRGAGEDPLNQRSTIGWKALKTAEILVDEYLVRYESAASLYADVAAN